MTYPEEIVCRSVYKEKLPIEDLNAEEYCVTRRIEGNVADNVDFQNGKPVLDPDCVGTIVEMSVNLLGGLFIPEHTLWVQEGEGKAMMVNMFFTGLLFSIMQTIQMTINWRIKINTRPITMLCRRLLTRLSLRVSLQTYQ